jgi:ferredoxin
MAYTFLFDSSYCSGCKACQAACKDKNQLPTGVLWRRVYEMSGGNWQEKDSAWTTDVYAYNISMACNHCEHPKCAGVCPTNAYIIRPDGIVLLDTQRRNDKMQFLPGLPGRRETPGLRGSLPDAHTGIRRTSRISLQAWICAICPTHASFRLSQPQVSD